MQARRLSIVLCIAAWCASLALADTQLRLATLNVRGEAAGHTSHPRGKDAEYPWDVRKGPMLKSIRSARPDVIGFQEPSLHQLAYIRQSLGSNYECLSKKAGLKVEWLPICWNKNKINQISVSQFWLSPTPDVPDSKGWGSNGPRSALVGQFRIKSTREEFYVVNTHLDPWQEQARLEAANLILSRVQPLTGGQNGGKNPLVVVLGDLNADPRDAPYQYLTGRRYVKGVRPLPNTLVDLRRVSGDDMTTVTYRAYRGKKRKEGFIDYILAADNGALGKKHWNVDKFALPSNTFRKDGKKVRYSDHRMLVAVLSRDN